MSSVPQKWTNLYYGQSSKRDCHPASRGQRKLTWGDALIAATSLERGYVLATCNTSDFAWISDLRLVDPLLESVRR